MKLKIKKIYTVEDIRTKNLSHLLGKTVLFSKLTPIKTVINTEEFLEISFLRVLKYTAWHRDDRSLFGYCSKESGFFSENYHSLEVGELEDFEGFELPEPELKPVNEACLLKPVNIYDLNGFLVERLLIGFCRISGMYYCSGSKNSNGFGYNNILTIESNYVKRIPGYVYGDENEQ